MATEPTTGGGGGNADLSGISEIANQLATLSKDLAEEQVKAEMIMAPAKTEKSVAGKGA